MPLEAHLSFARTIIFRSSHQSTAAGGYSSSSSFIERPTPKSSAISSMNVGMIIAIKTDTTRIHGTYAKLQLAPSPK
jgi:hypothetical protein